MRSQPRPSSLSPPVSEKRDHILGPADAPVTLLEYGDYECPYCVQAHIAVGKVRAHFGDELRFAFRNFPMSQVHPHAARAAEAAEAAGAQGLFWEMHDTLYENEDALDDESLYEYAELIGLDVSEFVRALTGGVYAPRVREDFLSGVGSGVNGTPTFFINGGRHDGPWDVESLIIAIEEAGAHGVVRRGNTRGTGHR